ncbi:MAG TPA: hypothetical protein VFS90_11170 [Pyrinomonadaceae bacterium]|nr:hypothetical protein [Pyrinomonadaceae bacterium]
MSSSRREFLKRGTFVAIAAGAPLGLAEKAFGLGTAKSVAGLNLDLESFEAQLGTSFLIKHEASTVNVRLMRVTNFASHHETEAGKEGFSLLFRGPKETPLKQDTYLIEHETLGRFYFLVVPVGTKDTRAPHYEAVINRLHS